MGLFSSLFTVPLPFIIIYYFFPDWTLPAFLGRSSYPTHCGLSITLIPPADNTLVLGTVHSPGVGPTPGMSFLLRLAVSPSYWWDTLFPPPPLGAFTEPLTLPPSIYHLLPLHLSHPSFMFLLLTDWSLPGLFYLGGVWDALCWGLRSRAYVPRVGIQASRSCGPGAGPTSDGVTSPPLLPFLWMQH